MSLDLILKSRIIIGRPDKCTASKFQICTFCGTAVKSLSVYIPGIINIYNITCLGSAACDLLLCRRC